MIDIVTSGDFNNVEVRTVLPRAHLQSTLSQAESHYVFTYSYVQVLIVREWTVRHKEYKATWTTGKFLHDARLKVLRSRKMSAGQESE